MTSSSSLGPVQRAIYEALAGDTTLAGKVTGVFDMPADGQILPYVTLGEATEVLDDTHDHDGRMLTHTLHVWSQATGFSEALGIVDDLNRLLNHKRLPLSDGSMVHCLADLVQPLRDPDGITVHVIARYRIWTQIP